MVEVGSTVGNYEVLEKVGQGAMGAVYLARHPSIGKRVALKVIRPELSNDEEVIVRFFNEARAVTQIGHPHIIDVQDFGQTPTGDSFIVMELLEGQTLGALLTSGPLAIDRAVRIAAQVADGLAAAHLRGIVHRDLKPDNVFLVRRGDDPDFVKILDFGLAKLSGPGALSHKTKTGAVLGTPHYMAPEAAEGSRNVDLRADVYALGCILYQMVTGRVPFPGEGFGEVLVRHLREPPLLPTRVRADTPASLEKIILHALAKKPDFRFASMDEFARALRNPARWELGFDDHLLEESIRPGPAVQAAQPIVRSTPRVAQASTEQKTVAAEIDARATMPPTPRPTAKVPHYDPPPRKAASGIGLALVAALVILGGAGGLIFRIVTAPVTLQITSTPAGAEVLLADRVVATTPASIPIPRRADVVVTLRKTGYIDARRALHLEHDALVELTLEASAPTHAPEPTRIVVLPATPPSPGPTPVTTLASPATKAVPTVTTTPTALAVAPTPPKPAKRPHRAKPQADLFHPDGALLAPNF